MSSQALQSTPAASSRLWFGLVLAGLLVLSACNRSNSDGEDGVNANSGTTTTASPDTAEEVTTSTSPPIIITVQPRLELLQGACFAEAPPTTPPPSTIPTTTTTEPPLEPPPTDAEGNVIETTTTVSTTLPESEPVAVVDCNGTQAGEIYANGCMGVNPPDARVRVQPVGCPGVFEQPFPGTRDLSVASAKFCLEQFELFYGESYAVSELTVSEWFPTEELWVVGDRRTVCTSRSE